MELLCTTFGGKWVRILKCTIILLSTFSFFLIKLFMFWVWGTCPLLYKLISLRYFCGYLYDLNSLSLFLSSNSSVYIETTIHAWHVDRGLGDDHSAAIFYFNLDDASSLLCFFDRCFFSASNFRADAAEIFAQSCMGLF